MSLQNHDDRAVPATGAQRRDSIAGFVAAIFGSDEGLCHWAYGANGRFLDGSYKFSRGNWHEQREFAYPNLSGEPYSRMANAATESDVYINPYLMRSEVRAKGNAVSYRLIHADWDGTPELLDACREKIRTIGGFATGSGTLAHLHGYVRLAQPVSEQRHRQLTEALQRYLPPGCDRGKKAASDMLRPVGTFNHKGRARAAAGIDAAGRSEPVQWDIEPDGSAVDPDTLAEIFRQAGALAGPAASGADSRPAAPRCATNGSAPVPADLDALPEPVRAALAHSVVKPDGQVDKSETTAHVVGACVDAGLTLPQTRGAVASRADLAERLAHRPDDDVLACWLKAHDARQVRKQEQAEAAEFYNGYAPREMTRTATYPEARPAAGDQSDHHETLVLQQLSRMRVRAEAQRRLDDQTRPALVLPPIKALDDLLSEPDSAAAYLIGEVQPVDSRVMLSAQYKAGKTTLVGNLARSLVDGDKFLGHFEINRPCAHIVLIDNELSENMIRSWMRAQGIANTAAVADVIALRGKVSTFNLLDDKCRDAWAQRLRDTGCDYLVLDCLRPVLDSLGLDENRDAGTFLVAYDEFLDAAGVPNSVLVQHMGHANERARGDSRLQDWPDAIWRLVREDDQPESPRYFSAYGRDVDVREGALSFDPLTRRLTYGQGGSRVDARAEDAMQTVIEVLAEDTRNGGGSMSKREIERATTGSDHNRQAIRDGIGLALARGYVIAAPGQHRATVLSIASPCTGCGKPILASTGDWHRSCTPTGTGSRL